MRAGVAAYQQGKYEEASLQFERALKEAETFGKEDLRYASTLSDLASTQTGSDSTAGYDQSAT